jgi:hypothetical protein
MRVKIVVLRKKKYFADREYRSKFAFTRIFFPHVLCVWHLGNFFDRLKIHWLLYVPRALKCNSAFSKILYVRVSLNNFNRLVFVI